MSVLRVRTASRWLKAILASGSMSMLALAASLSALAPVTAEAQNFPLKPITMIVPYGAGGGTDVTARLISTEMAKYLGQQIVVENRIGAGGGIGGNALAKSKPDGYTMCFCGASPTVILGLLNPRLPYKPERDLAPVGQVGDLQLVLVVRADSPYKNLAEVIAAGKSSSLTYGHPGNGTTLHLAGELFRVKIKGNIVAVPYRSDAASLTDLLGGQLDMVFTAVSAANSLIKANRVRAIAVTNARRSEVLAGVPTFAEAGLHDYAVGAFYGVSVAAGTPNSIVGILSKALLATMADPAVRSHLEGHGITVVGSSPSEYQRFLENEFKTWGPLVRELKLTME